MPRRTALASGIFLLISILASSKSHAAAVFAGGSINPTPSQVVCSGGTGTFSFTASSIAGGGSDWTANYQWESSPNNVTWTPIAGATGSFSAASPVITYVTPVLTFAGPGCSAPTYYRVVISSISNTVVGSPFIGTTTPTAPYLTVCPNPAAITGPNSVCEGSTITVADATGGGVWSSSTGAVGSISGSGVITGISGGTTTISYTVSGCSATTVVTVNPRPSLISGDSTVCVGSTITVFDTTIGGTWSMVSATPHLSITDIGVVSGLAAATVQGLSSGTNLITYTSSGGCTRTKQITVNALPTIGGVLALCQNTTTTLTGSPAGGTWLSGNGSVASIGSSSGIVSGLAGGTSLVTYTNLAGCSVTATVTVNPAPLPITGTFTVCVGSTTSLASGTPGGIWSSSSGLATVGGTTGVVSGVSAGTAVITYMLTSSSCFTTTVVTVLPIPVSITGTTGLQLCEGGNTTTLSDATFGGTWASSTGSVATIGSSDGIVVSGVAGTTVISYTLPSGCYTTSVFTTNPLPTSITGSLTTCAGSTTTLSGTPSGGVWTTSSPLVTVNSSTGVVTAGATTGTASITYTLSTGCSLSTVVTVTTAPPAVTGTLTACVGSCTSLSHVTPGGTWTSSNTAVGTVNSSGVVCGVSGGTTIITYTLPGGCLAFATVTVSAPPSPITGPGTVCVGATITLSSSTPGGSWSSSIPTNGTVGAANGVVGGVFPGTTVITYSLTAVANCSVTKTVTVNAGPTAITANPSFNICVGATTTLNSTPAGGTWSTVTPGIASVNLTTGVVTGVSASGGGMSTITYTDLNGCRTTAVVTVSPNPSILGGLNVCPGTTTTLAGIPAGGTWSSSNGTGTIIVFGTGVVTGVAAGAGGTSGTGIVTYTVPGGCFTTAIVTINPLPNPIVATSTNICVAGTSTVTNTTPGGTWSSTPTSVATVTPTTGIVTGIAGGTVNITYTLSTGCYSWLTLTVDPLLPAITGAAHVCLGSSTTLSNTITGGTWTSSITSVATIGSSTGIVTGMGVGTTIISYSTASGCLTTMVFTVDPLPTITPTSATVCIGATATLAGAPAGGTWSTTSGNVTVGSSSGVVTGVAAGTADVTYTLSTGCTATATITVNPLPLPDASHGAICQFDSITLTNPTPGGGTWSSTSSNVVVNGTSGVVTGVFSGTAIIVFTSTATGCTINDTVTINVGPGPINGLHSICFGDSTQLFGSPSGGFWTSAPPFFVAINPVTGMAHGVGVGVSTISYTLPSGCASTFSMTVNPLPTAISVAPICVGSSTTATSSPVGGTWTAGPASVGFIDPVTGLLTGLSAGTITLTYTLPTGCSITAVDTVYPLPTPIVGDTQICAGFTGTLTSTPAGGTWTSANTFILTVGSTTGIINAIYPGGGTVTVTYVDPHGCAASKVITVNPIPPNIDGDSMVCVGGTITLSDITTGGTWLSSNTFVASIGSASGIVTGLAPGTTRITYTLPTGCYITKVITVNPNPAPITGTMVMCSGSCVTLNVLTAGGSWTSSNPSIATPTGIGIGVAQVCGTMTGVTPGTATISYTLGTGCYVTAVVTVYPNPGPVGGVQICKGDTITLTNTIPGGTWAVSSGTGTATIDPATGLLTGTGAGTVTVSYTVWPTNCFVTGTVTINPQPAAITGDSTVCLGSTITLSDATPGGSFSTSSTTVSVTPSGVVTGVNVGTGIVTYTNNTTGCFITKVITVNPVPSIFGATAVCQNDSAIVYSTSPGGIWAVTPPGIVSINTINPLTGGDSLMVHGVGAGSVIITYTLPTGCFDTASFIVHPQPSPILGVGVMCKNDSTTLYDTTNLVTGSAGTWSSTNLTGSITTLPILPVAGAADSLRVYGISAGTARITYTESTFGCIITRVVTVNPLPTPIFGTDSVCVGSSSTLHDTTIGGHWTTSDAGIAIVDTNGVVTGIDSGTVTISYILNATGCYVTHVYTVRAIPNVTVNHPGVICRKSSTTLTASGANNYLWTPTTGLSSSTGATVTASPTITTTYTVTGTNLLGLCSDTAIVTVYVDTLLNHIGITGTDTICVGMCDTLIGVGFHGSLFSWVPPAGLSCNVCDTTVACPAGTTTYLAVAIDSFGCRDTASFTITVMPLPRLTYDPNPPFVCFGDSTQITVTDLNATSTYTTKFAWFPNVFLSCDTCPSPWVSDTFNLVYRVIGISPFGCYDSIKIPVSVLKNSVNTISKDTVICLGECVQLRSSSVNPDGSTSTFTWLPANMVNNSTIPTPITCPKATTTYTLVISPNVCFHDTETVTVGVSPKPEIQITPGSKQVVAGTPIPLSAVITNGVLITSYAWAPASTLSCEVCYGTIATPTFTTTYVFTATSNYGCTNSDSVRFTTTCDNSQIFIPNTFTPNGDGMNDRFFISGKGISKITNFLVFNRWGELVFENHNIAPNDPGAGWDGTYKGLVVPPDVFMYVVEGECELGSPLKYVGDVSIVR